MSMLMPSPVPIQATLARTEYTSAPLADGDGTRGRTPRPAAVRPDEDQLPFGLSPSVGSTDRCARRRPRLPGPGALRSLRRLSFRTPLVRSATPNEETRNP
jgi:hypothetical protein